MATAEQCITTVPRAIVRLEMSLAEAAILTSILNRVDGPADSPEYRRVAGVRTAVANALSVFQADESPLTGNIRIERTIETYGDITYYPGDRIRDAVGDEYTVESRGRALHAVCWPHGSDCRDWPLSRLHETIGPLEKVEDNG